MRTVPRRARSRSIWWTRTGHTSGPAAWAVSVQNVAPAVTGLSRSATTLAEAGSLTLSGTFADAGLLDAHTVRIDWGDGTAEQVLALAPGARQFAIAHQYQDDSSPGTQITVQVSDGVADSTAGNDRGHGTQRGADLRDADAVRGLGDGRRRAHAHRRRG